jgi:predicted transport protein
MGDIKLFRTGGQGAKQLEGKSVVVEKTLQALMEKHLDEFLGVRFLASEHQTGKTHGGRIDSLGVDENNSPVIIEYKRAMNENVINQGLFYMDWLLDHKAEFTLLAMNRLGADVEHKIDWAGTRLICIAADFTKYDEHAVQQINRNIELIRYLRFGEDLLLLEQVNAVTVPGATGENAKTASAGKGGSGTYKSVTEYLGQAPADLQDLQSALDAFLLALGDDVQFKTTHFYLAYRRIKNFACVQVHPKSRKLLVFVKVEPTPAVIVPGFARDVRKIGHYGTGDLEITLSDLADLEKAKPLLLQRFEAN